MKGGRLNVRLLENLFLVCERKMKETLREAGVSYNTWREWVLVEKGESTGSTRERGGVPVEGLVKVCNTLRVPVSRMFYQEGEPMVLPIRRELVVPPSYFRPMDFNMDLFRYSFGKRGKSGKTQLEMLKEMGVTEEWFRRWTRKGNSTLRVAMLERFCDTFGYDILVFFETVKGEGDSSVSEPPVEEPPVSDELEKLASENDKLARENERLFLDNKELKELAALLKDEVTQLKVQKSEQAYEIVRLKHRIAELENGFTGMVAED